MQVSEDKMPLNIGGVPNIIGDYSLSVVGPGETAKKLWKKARERGIEVGAKVRQTIKELGGTMPEDLPTPQKSIKQIEREQEKKKLANKN